MKAAETFPVKQAFLYSLIASVLVSALLGIVAILSGSFGWLEIRIILTTVTIAVASICGLASGAYLGTSAGRLIPFSGIALTLSAAAMIILGMWTEIESEVYWKFAASFSVFAVACSHLSLLSMARIADWFQWSLIAAHVIIFGVASLIVLMILFEINATGMFQLLGVAAIVDAAITILIPILHKLSRPEFAALSDSNLAPDHESIDAEIARLKDKVLELEQMKNLRC